jgi:hypothetical protein
MNRNILVIVSTLVLCGAGPLAVNAQGQRGGGSSLSALDTAASEALITALAGPDGEYAAHAEYTAILAKFGSTVKPYANIVNSEKQHIAALQQQCVKFGVPVPADTHLGNVTAPATLLEAAQTGVYAENLNVTMYNTLLSKVQKYPSLVQVFTNLRDASLNRHLAAFEAAVANGGTCPGTCVGAASGTCCGMGKGAGKGLGKGNGTCARLRDGSCVQ